MKLLETSLILLFLLSAYNIYGQYNSKSEELIDSLAFLDIVPTDEVLKSELLRISNLANIEKDYKIEFEALSYLAFYLYDESEFLKYFRAIEKMDASFKKIVEKDDDQLCTLLNNKALICEIRGDYEGAISYLIKVLSIVKQKTFEASNEDVGVYNYNISTLYSFLGDDGMAIKFIEKSIASYTIVDSSDYIVNKSEKYFHIAQSQFEKASILYRNFKLDEAEEVLSLSRFNISKYIDDPEARLNFVIDIELFLCNICLDKRDESCLKTQRNRLSELSKKSNYKRFKIERMNAIYEAKYESDNNLDSVFKKAIQLLTLDSTRKYGESEFAKLYFAKAEEILKREDFENAIKNIELGLRSNKDSEFKKNTEFANLNQRVFIDLLTLKVKCHLGLYRDTNSDEHLSGAFNPLMKLTSLLDKMKSSYLTQGSKFYAAEKAYPIYNQAMYVLHEKYKRGQADSTLNLIYNVMEKNKSSILFESVEDKYKLLASGLPEELIEEESSLKSSISFYSKLKSEEEAKDSVDEQKIKDLEDAIFDAEEKYAILNQKIKSEYADFYDYRENITQEKTLKDLQECLTPGQLVLEYYEGDSSLYILSVDRKTAHLEKIDLANVKELAIDYRKLVSHSPNDGIGMASFIEASSALANVILENALSKHKDIDELIIIPDGQLNQIPFESLILGKDKADLNYAIKEYEIAYYFSIDQFISKNKEVNKITPKVLCIAPVFTGRITDSRACDIEDLGKLPHAQDELKHIEDKFEGLFIASNQTKKSDLLNNIEKYPVIHLATHACLNTVDPLLSEIHFNDGHLTNYDIRDLKVRPELVVLSACNTAQGEVKKGEGMISLSRGFFEAGVKSLQASLWSIDDYASAEIVKSMYSYLSDGQTKSSALRQAKLDHLLKADKLRQHPYYWAGIIQIGDQSPLFSKTSWKPWAIGLGLGLLLIGGLAYRKKMAA